MPVLIKQFLVRSSAILLVKAIGVLAKLPLFRMVGGEGMGLYQIAYSLYGLLYVLLTGGFSTALSIMTAREYRQGLRMFRFSILLLAPLGAVFGLFVYVNAAIIADWFGKPELEWAVRCLAPAIVIVPLLGVIRGFLQGLQYFGLIAFSEVLEQCARVGAMLILVAIWIQQDIALAVGGATFGAFAGAAVALLFLSLFLLAQSGKSEPLGVAPTVSLSEQPTTLLFLSSSLSILGTRIIYPISDFLNAWIVPKRLVESGYSGREATAIFGEITGMTVAVVSIPTIITSALCHILTAHFSADWEQKRRADFRQRTRRSLEVVFLWGLGSTLLLFHFAEELSLLVAGNDSLAKAIRYLAVYPLLIGLRELTTILLWIMGLQKEPLIASVLGTLSAVAVNYVLVAVPGFGYAGVAVGILTFEFVVILLNLLQLKKQVKELLVAYSFLRHTVYLLVGVFLGVVITDYVFASFARLSTLLVTGKVMMAGASLVLTLLFAYAKPAAPK
nr:oligosaccharide flippase family protein [Brevibacillus fulvus]